MSDDVIVGNRRRSNSGPPTPMVKPTGTGGGGVETSEHATNLFETLGKTVKVPPPLPEKGPELSPEMKQAAKDQRKYWYDQIRVATIAITKDIDNLSNMPGQLPYANGFRKRLKALAPGPDVPVKELRACSAEMNRLQTEVHGYVAEKLEGLRDSFKTTKAQRAKYEKLHGELAELEKRLDAYPTELTGTQGKDGVQSFVATELAPGRQKAELFYERLHFDAALEEMQKVHAKATQQLKDLDGRDKDLRGGLTGRGPFVGAYKALDELNTAIEEAAGVAGEAAMKPFRKQSEAYYIFMIQAVKNKGKDQKQLGEQITGKIEATKLAVQKSVDEQKTLKIGLDNALTGLTRTIVERGPLRPQSELDEASSTLDEIRALMARFDYVAAKQKAAELGNTVFVWEKLPLPNDPSRPGAIGKQAIELFRKPAEAEQKRAQDFLKMAGTVPVLALPPTPQSVIDMLQTQLDMFASNIDAYPVPQGIDAVDRARQVNDSIQKRIDASKMLTQVRRDHDAEVQKLLKETATAIDAFKAKLAKSGTADAMLPTYEAPMRRASDEWEAAMQRATSVTVLDEVLDSVILQLKTVKEQAEADIDNPDRLIDAVLEAKLAQLDAGFRTADDAARKAVHDLIEADYEKADAQRVAADGARNSFVAARKKQDVKAAQAALTALQTVAKEAARQAEAALAERGRVVKEFFELNSAVTVTRTKLGKAAESGPCKDYAAVVSALADKHVSIGRLGKSHDASVIRMALDDLKALQAECRKLESLFGKISVKGGKAGPGDITIDSLTKRLDDIKLKDETVKDYEAAALTDIQARKDTVAKAVGTVMLSESDKQIEALAKDWADLKNKAGKHKTEVTLFRADVATALNGFIKMTDKKAFKAYFEDMTGRLKALDVAADKDKVTDQKALDQIKKDIAFNNSAGKTGLQRANDESEADALRDELEKQQFIVEYAAFEGRIKSLDAVLKNIDDPDAKKTLKAQREQTVSAAEAITGSTFGKIINWLTRTEKPAVPYATKREQLRALAKNVNNMIRYPMGLETHARGQILEVVQFWDRAVTDFHGLLDALPGAIGTAMKDDENKEAAGDVVQKVTARVGQLKTVLVPGTITASAKAVAAAGKDMATAREARELALREVSRLRSLVEGAAFKSTAQNPFEVDVLTGLSALSASLFDVETNLTISL